MLTSLLTCILLFPKESVSDHVAHQQLFTKLAKTSYAPMAPFYASDKDAPSSKQKILFDPLSMRISGVDEKSQTIEVVMRVNVTWNDYRLSWDSSEFGGIYKVIMMRESIWRPIILPCKFISLTTNDNAKGLVMVYSDGHVQDTLTWSYTAPGDVKLHDFPFDTHELTLCFDVRTLEGTNAQLVGRMKECYNDEAEIEWDITERMKLLPRNASNDVTINFGITIKRYNTFWIHLVILPCFVLGFLVIAGLVLNGDNPSIESVHFYVNIGLASTVSTAVALSTMTDNFPKTSRIPSLGSFVLNQILLILAAIVTLSIRRSLMDTIEQFITYLEKDIEKCRYLKWKRRLVATIKVARHRYFLFTLFQFVHFSCFLWMMRYHESLSFFTSTICTTFAIQDCLS